MNARLALAAAFALAFGAGCTRDDPASKEAATASGAPTYAEAGCDDDGFERVRSAEASGSNVVVCGRVISVAGDFDTRSGLHKHWRLDVRDRHRPIEIDSNEDLEGRFDAAPGDYAIVAGEYYHDPNGREGIHYTHRDPRGRHAPGFVLIRGRTIE